LDEKGVAIRIHSEKPQDEEEEESRVVIPNAVEPKSAPDDPVAVLGTATPLPASTSKTSTTTTATVEAEAVPIVFYLGDVDEVKHKHTVTVADRGIIVSNTVPVTTVGKHGHHHRSSNDEDDDDDLNPTLDKKSPPGAAGACGEGLEDGVKELIKTRIRSNSLAVETAAAAPPPSLASNLVLFGFDAERAASSSEAVVVTLAGTGRFSVWEESTAKPKSHHPVIPSPAAGQRSGIIIPKESVSATGAPIMATDSVARVRFDAPSEPLVAFLQPPTNARPASTTSVGSADSKSIAKGPPSSGPSLVINSETTTVSNAPTMTHHELRQPFGTDDAKADPLVPSLDTELSAGLASEAPLETTPQATPVVQKISGPAFVSQPTIDRASSSPTAAGPGGAEPTTKTTDSTSPLLSKKKPPMSVDSVRASPVTTAGDDDALPVTMFSMISERDMGAILAEASAEISAVTSSTARFQVWGVDAESHPSPASRGHNRREPQQQGANHRSPTRSIPVFPPPPFDLSLEQSFISVLVRDRLNVTRKLDVVSAYSTLEPMEDPLEVENAEVSFVATPRPALSSSASPTTNPLSTTTADAPGEHQILPEAKTTEEDRLPFSEAVTSPAEFVEEPANSEKEEGDMATPRGGESAATATPPLHSVSTNNALVELPPSPETVTHAVKKNATTEGSNGQVRPFPTAAQASDLGFLDDAQADDATFERPRSLDMVGSAVENDASAVVDANRQEPYLPTASLASDHGYCDAQTENPSELSALASVPTKTHQEGNAPRGPSIVEDSEPSRLNAGDSPTVGVTTDDSSSESGDSLSPRRFRGCDKLVMVAGDSLTDREVVFKDETLSTTATSPAPAEPTTASAAVDELRVGSKKTLLVLHSRESCDRQVVSRQDRAFAILGARSIPYDEIDGSDPRNKDRRNELFALSNLRAKYPQFFLVENNITEFWGVFDRLEASNDMGTLLSDLFGNNLDAVESTKEFAELDSEVADDGPEHGPSKSISSSKEETKPPSVAPPKSGASVSDDAILTEVEVTLPMDPTCTGTLDGRDNVETPAMKYVTSSALMIERETTPSDKGVERRVAVTLAEIVARSSVPVSGFSESPTVSSKPEFSTGVRHEKVRGANGPVNWKSVPMTSPVSGSPSRGKRKPSRTATSLTQEDSGDGWTTVDRMKGQKSPEAGEQSLKPVKQVVLDSSEAEKPKSKSRTRKSSSSKESSPGAPRGGNVEFQTGLSLSSDASQGARQSANEARPQVELPTPRAPTDSKTGAERATRIRAQSSEKTDITVYGATSFVAQHVLTYLSQTSVSLPRPLKITLSGRNLEKLESCKLSCVRRMGSLITLNADATGTCEFDIFVAESDDIVALDEMAKRTTVVLNCAGPYAKYSSNVVGACARAGTNHLDITGEVRWARSMRETYGSESAKSGSRIISFCGFDSIPSDISVFAAVCALQKVCKKRSVAISSATTWHSSAGGVNGGTLHTVLDIPFEPSHFLPHPVPHFVEDPLSLVHPRVRADPAIQETRNRLAAAEWVNMLPRAESIFCLGVSIPFFMAVVNSKVVHASSVALKYGSHFKYYERMVPAGYKFTTKLRLLSIVPAIVVILATTAALAILKIPFIGSKLAMWLLPPGAGSSERACAAGYAEVYAEVSTAPNKVGLCDKAYCMVKFQGGKCECAFYLTDGQSFRMVLTSHVRV
jgi:hypothetical protein